MRHALALAAVLLAGAAAARAQLATRLDCGVPVEAALTPNGPSQLFTFRTTERDDAVVIRALSFSTDPNFKFSATLRDPNLRPIAPRRTSVFSQSGGREFDLPDPGDYTVEIQSTDPNLGGAFRILMARLKGPCNSAALQCGAAVAAQLAAPLAVHSYQVQGESGDTFSIRLAKTNVKTAEQRDANFGVAVFDAAGQLETTPDKKFAAASSTTNLKLDLRFSSRGARTVLVFEFANGVRTGMYSIGVARLNGPCRSRTTACGAVVDAAIADPLQIDSYSIAAAAGDNILLRRVRTDSGSLRPLLEVYDPEGNYVAPVPSSDLSRYAFTAPSAGTYTALVADDLRVDGTRTGAYSLSFARLNRPCNTQPLACGAVADGTVDAPLRFATYSATAEAGDVFLLRLMRTRLTGSFRPRAEVYGPAGGLIQSASTADQGRAAFKAAAAGTYTILLADGSDGTGTGPYSVALARLNRPCNAQPLACGALASGSIDAPLRFATYTYTAEAADAFTVRMIDPNGALPQESIEVYGPDGNAAGTAVPGNVQAVDVVRATAGVYTILAMDTGPTPSQGPFAVQLFKTRNGCGAPAAAGANVRGLVSGAAPFTAYTLAASAGDTMTVRSASFTPNFTAAMELFDAEGARVSTGTFTVSAAVKAAGALTLIVGASAPRTAGSYALSWQALNRPAAVQPLACGTTAAGVLTPAGEFRWFSAAAGQGDLLRLLLTRVSGNFTPNLELYDPAGARLTGAGTGFSLKAAVAGDYLALVAPSTATGETGAFALSYQRPNNPCLATSIACGQTVLRAVDAPGQTDTYTFTGNAGDRAILRIPPRVGAWTPFVELYDPAGTLLQTGATTQIARDLAASGTFTLLVRDLNGINTGTYRVGLQRSPEACSQDDKEPPVVRLRRPTGGEVLTGGLPYRIAWESDDNVDVASHEVRLSTDGGKTFPTILASGLAGTIQSFDWQVLADVKPVRTAAIRVTAADAAGNTASAASDLLTLIGSGFTENSAATFEYDALDRLIKATYADGTVVEYTWDAAGNLLRVGVR